MAVSIGVLIERFYGELWNRWNDSAVEGTLSPGFIFRGSLGQQTSDRQGWRRYRDLVHEGSADFHNEIVELVCDGGLAAARHRFTGTHTGPLPGAACNAAADPFTRAAAAIARQAVAYAALTSQPVRVRNARARRRRPGLRPPR